jgi:hypothetical protein
VEEVKKMKETNALGEYAEILEAIKNYFDAYDEAVEIPQYIVEHPDFKRALREFAGIRKDMDQ